MARKRNANAERRSLLFWMGPVTDDRRAVRRAKLPGVRAVCSGTKGEHVEADVLDLGTGGLFVRSVRPLTIGQRLAIDICLVGDTVEWSVLGRVVWTREASEGQHRPAGMGIKFIVVDNPIAAAIERMIDAHERQAGAPRAAAPARERTVLGVGPPDEPSFVRAVPVLVVAPARERTILGVGSAAETPPREVSMAIDLVSKKPPAVPPVSTESAPPVSAERATAAAEELDHSRPRERRGHGWLVLVLLLAATAAAYRWRDRLRREWREWQPRVMRRGAELMASPTAPTPAPAPAPAPTTTTPTPTTTPTTTTTTTTTTTAAATTTPTTRPGATPSASAAKRGLGGAPSGAPAARPNVKPDENPY
jgi:Tfp pilus assembly protein PilZ